MAACQLPGKQQHANYQVNSSMRNTENGSMPFTQAATLTSKKKRSWIGVSWRIQHKAKHTTVLLTERMEMMARGKRIGAVLVEKEEKRGRHLVGGWCDEFLCGYSTVLRVRPYVRTVES